MNIYEPDPELELQILRGLFQSKVFIRRFTEMRVKAEVFESEDAEHLRRIVTKLTQYFTEYGDLMKPSQLFAEVAREETEREAKDGELSLARIKRIVGQALVTAVRPAELPYLLDSLIETHKRWRIVQNAKEIVRFYDCQFEHMKHEACKGCPVWSNCKFLQGSEKGLSDKIVYMQSVLQGQLDEATGDTSVQKSQLSQNLLDAEERYMARKKARAEGGKDFTFGIPTPWPTVTKDTDGWKPGNLYGVWAPKKTGKTISAIMVAAECIRAGHDVVSFAMEDDEKKWLDKFFCQQSCVEWADFQKGTLSDAEEDRIRTVRQHYTEAWEEGTIGDIHQYHRPINQIGLDDMRAHLGSLRAQGVNFGMFILDHMMIAKKPWRRDLTRDDQRLNAIAEGSKALAQDFNCAAIVIHQLKTSGERKGQGRGSDQLEDCFDAVWHLNYFKGVMMMRASVARDFAPHEFELNDLRNRLLLPENEDESSTLPDEAIDIPDEGWLG